MSVQWAGGRGVVVSQPDAGGSRTPARPGSPRSVRSCCIHPPAGAAHTQLCLLQPAVKICI